MTFLLTTMVGADGPTRAADLLSKVQTQLANHSSGVWSQVDVPTRVNSSEVNASVWENSQEGFFIYFRTQGNDVRITVGEEYDGTDGAETMGKLALSPGSTLTLQAGGYFWNNPLGFDSNSTYLTPMVSCDYFADGDPVRIVVTSSYFMICAGDLASTGGPYFNGSGNGYGTIFCGVPEPLHPGHHDYRKPIGCLDLSAIDRDGTYSGSFTRSQVQEEGYSRVDTGAVSIHTGTEGLVLSAEFVSQVGGGLTEPRGTVIARQMPFFGLTEDFYGWCPPNVLSIQYNVSTVVQGDTVSVFGGTDNAIKGQSVYWWVDIDPETL